MFDRIAPMPTRRSVATLQAVRDFTGGGFDADAWHVMDQRDNALIADEVLSGSGSSKFVYEFNLSGTIVTGISVIGARHLAAHYGGIKHRLVASIQKVGSLFTFTSYPGENTPMNVDVKVIDALERHDDYYEAIVEIGDVKTGNAIQVQKRESRIERKRNGDEYERQHYQIIAQAKAYRNGVLAIIPQDVQLKFKLQMLELGKSDVITGSVLEEKRAGVLRFAGAKALPVNRRSLEGLTLAQISGLSDAARAGIDQFREAADALGIMGGSTLAVVAGAAEAAAAAKPPREAAPPAKTNPAPTKSESQPAAAAFTAYLYDEVGEMTNGPMDAATFADEYLKLEAKTLGVDDRAALATANAEALAHQAVQAVMAEAKPPPAAEAKPEEEKPDPTARMPLGKGRGAIDEWIKKAGAVFAALDDGSKARWLENNKPVFEAFGQVHRVELRKAGITSGPAPAPQQNGIDQKHPLVEWVDQLVAEIAKATSEEAVAMLQKAGEARAEELNALNPALLRRVRGAANARETELQAQAEGGA